MGSFIALGSKEMSPTPCSFHLMRLLIDKEAFFLGSHSDI